MEPSTEIVPFELVSRTRDPSRKTIGSFKTSSLNPRSASSAVCVRGVSAIKIEPMIYLVASGRAKSLGVRPKMSRSSWSKAASGVHSGGEECGPESIMFNAIFGSKSSRI